MNKAIFLDRDGTLISLVYDKENSIVRTPLSAKEIYFEYNVISVLKKILTLGYKIIIVSNQPDIGLGKINKKTFNDMQKKIESYLATHNIFLHGYYYCFHHPHAKLKEFKKKCNCRKPMPGLIQKSAKEHTVDLQSSWMIGDGVNDVIAGHKAGCNTILVANLLEAGYLRLLEHHLQGVTPDHIVKSLIEVPSLL